MYLRVLPESLFFIVLDRGYLFSFYGHFANHSLSFCLCHRVYPPFPGCIYHRDFSWAVNPFYIWGKHRYRQEETDQGCKELICLDPAQLNLATANFLNGINTTEVNHEKQTSFRSPGTKMSADFTALIGSVLTFWLIRGWCSDGILGWYGNFGAGEECQAPGAAWLSDSPVRRNPEKEWCPGSGKLWWGARSCSCYRYLCLRHWWEKAKGKTRFCPFSLPAVSLPAFPTIGSFLTLGCQLKFLLLQSITWSRYFFTFLWSVSLH